MSWLNWLFGEDKEKGEQKERQSGDVPIPVYMGIRQLLESGSRDGYRKRPDIAALRMGVCGNMAVKFLRASDEDADSGAVEPPSGRVFHSGQAYCALYVDPQIGNFVKEYNMRPDITKGNRLNKCICKHLHPLNPTVFSLGTANGKDNVYRCEALRSNERRAADAARNTELRNKKGNGNGSRYPLR